ncbi:hypothetical protein TL16_g06467 [Triparma laevis f. inornata]|uniref:Uncharacterized protein n=1 Tax=Triparma laevis f. inornata TaxID=1714386 RepID=A0A9W7AMK9_9STRA|nr:hypothetical protein TL16_g06467 [Triparma laevis f. inornata]
MSKIASIASRFHRPLHRQFSSPSTSTNLLNPLTHLINLKNALSKYKATWGKDLSVFDEVTKVVDPQNVRNIEKIAGSNVDSKGDNITNSDLLNEVKDLKTLASNKNKDTLKADFKSFLSQNVTTFKLSVTAFTEGYR